MKEPAVLNSVCLISLSRIGQLRLLPELFEPCLIPPAVAEEVSLSREWLRVQSPADSPLRTLLRSVVDLGEAEAITLAAQPGYLLIIDDRKGRQWAQRLQIPISGTIGVLLRAKRRGLIAAVKPVLAQLKAVGFHLTGALEQEALRLAGEDIDGA